MGVSPISGGPNSLPWDHRSATVTPTGLGRSNSPPRAEVLIPPSHARLRGYTGHSGRKSMRCRALWRSCPTETSYREQLCPSEPAGRLTTRVCDGTCFREGAPGVKELGWRLADPRETSRTRLRIARLCQTIRDSRTLLYVTTNEGDTCLRCQLSRTSSR